MKKYILMSLAGVVATSIWAGQELAQALHQTPAPDQEYIRTPSKYIFKKLADTANRSGNPELAAFTVAYELTGSDSTKVSINLAGMTLFDAIQTVARSVGAGVDFQSNRAVLKDSSLVEEMVIETPDKPAPVIVQDDDEEEPRNRRKKDEPRLSFGDVSHALVFVENGDGRGSGFIAEMDGKIYVFSNQHNFLGAKRPKLKSMTGTYLKPKGFEFSRTHDIVRMPLDPADVEGLTVLKFNMNTPAIHDEIMIYGNSAGGGVATELDGEIIGVGPADIEITAKMVPGNSGSPILNHQAEVVGVATYATLGQEFEKGSAYYKMFKGTRFSKVRRYGIRIPENGWVNDSMSFYLRQTYRLEDMKSYLLAIYALFNYWQGDSSYDSVASRMISSYGSIASNGEPPFEFHMKDLEEQLRRVVRSFKINHNDLKDANTKVNTARTEDGTSHIKRLLSEGVETVKLTADKTRWKSNLLKRDAQSIRDMADEIISQINEGKNPYKSSKRRR